MNVFKRWRFWLENSHRRTHTSARKQKHNLLRPLFAIQCLKINRQEKNQLFIRKACFEQIDANWCFLTFDIILNFASVWEDYRNCIRFDEWMNDIFSSTVNGFNSNSCATFMCAIHIELNLNSAPPINASGLLSKHCECSSCLIWSALPNTCMWTLSFSHSVWFQFISTWRSTQIACVADSLKISIQF